MERSKCLSIMQQLNYTIHSGFKMANVNNVVFSALGLMIKLHILARLDRRSSSSQFFLLKSGLWIDFPKHESFYNPPPQTT